MAKRFQFDDENERDEIEEDVYEQPSRIDEIEDLKETPINMEDPDEEFEDFDGEEIQPMAKKKKKFVWKWWHYTLIGLGVLAIAFIIYLFMASTNDGPVYGKRCEGVVDVNKDLITSAIDTVKTKHSEVESLTMSIECRQLKVDIFYKEGMDTKKGKAIAEEAVQVLDGLVGKSKESGKTYSTLFGKIDNVSQYEVNLYLKSGNSKDFPIYGTKHTQKDEFNYTLASVKDEDSAKKAQDTLKDKK